MSNQNVLNTATIPLTVPQGGAGDNSLTAFSVLCGGTTDTAAIQTVASLGAEGTVLTSNGADELPSFQASAGAGSFTSITTQEFTSSGTYTPTSGMKYCIVQQVGGGGGGGGTRQTTSVGGGGGSGSYGYGVYSAATIGASQIVTIGAAGAAGLGSNTIATAGGTGGVTSLGSLLVCNGGVGGFAGSTAVIEPCVLGGLGGAAGSGGAVNTAGNPGDYGIADATISSNGVPISGKGASSYFGGGGRAVFNITSDSGTTGNNGVAFGSGGSGGASFAAAGGKNGGTGAEGYIVITEFN